MSAQFITPPQIPLPEDKGILLARLLDGLDSHALWWLSGYSAGLAGNQSTLLPSAPEPRSDGIPVTVVYGSQTGNAKRLAEQLAASIEHSGGSARLLRADSYPLRELKSERLLYVVISTQGDGDPPDDARGFLEHLSGKRAPQLPELHFAVLGLGDSSYPQFNAVARRVDARLAELGAQRLFDLGEADLDVETVADPWRKQALERAVESIPANNQRSSVVSLRPVASETRHDRDTPFAAEVLANQRISGRASEKDIRHLELSLEGSGLAYEPGDALGVWPRNSPGLVDQLLDLLELDGNAAVVQGSESHSLRDWLGGRRELTRLGRPFVATHAAMAGHAGLNRLLAPEQSATLIKLLGSHQLIDLLRAWPARWNAEELVGALRPLTPRLYSIASSQKIVGDEAHLTVAHVDYQAFGSRHHGAASGYLAQAGDDAHIPIFVEHNERFRLPADGSRDIIMIGPGTGIAPFRGFVQERAATAASGRNWLLFGNPHFDSDFLYQVEWQEALREGRIDRLDLAFSRDQASKVYVQHRLREHGRELHDWLSNGAHLYVCGDATRMARDVDDALIEIFTTHGNGDREQALEAIEVLRRDGRYARDVY
ncbi:MAG TPA: assimilatory sulfite reductase (NADPH) flavoprotein subunit [Dokdonella sp.]|uniref:assimilatory sulfite reductase (NADPH) flavoprotein subunit n=1 Tax=Dokdonella sp. TaxID=2291710 RepID=UPI002D7F6CA2|nr:assimilatory sulfite reductase (NADPH) flavoprotein subunit [Dokdonella sp.]HET9033197.1 assimilatory sulfite reductase (NADPH) flavoprotein subunit [Dokdonella sp.]